MNYNTVAKDKIAVIVNQKNPLSDITLYMLKSIDVYKRQDNKLKKKKLPVRSDSYDEWSYVDSSGEYIHSEEIKSKAEEK